MVGTSPNGPPPSEDKPSSANQQQTQTNSVAASGGGFGNGRRPDASFEQASLMTVEDDRLF